MNLWKLIWVRLLVIDNEVLQMVLMVVLFHWLQWILEVSMKKRERGFENDFVLFYLRILLESSFFKCININFRENGCIFWN